MGKVLLVNALESGKSGGGRKFEWREIPFTETSGAQQSQGLQKSFVTLLNFLGGKLTAQTVIFFKEGGEYQKRLTVIDDLLNFPL